MMIGGGGSGCNRADHGIGITETNAASFVEPCGVYLNMTLDMTPQQGDPSPTY